MMPDPIAASPGMMEQPLRLLAQFCLSAWFELRGGTVKDVFFAGVADPGAGRAVVVARARLRSGQMFDMTVSGPVANLADQLIELAALLDAGDIGDRLRQAETRMVDVLRKYRGSATIHRDASLLRLPSISLDMANKMVIAALNRARGKQGMPMLAELPPPLLAHLAALASTLDLAQEYMATFDAEAVHALDSYCADQGCGAAPLNAYNGLLANGSARNRAQALLALPSLFECLTMMRIRQGGVWTNEVDEHPARHGILRAIDSGAPLFQSLATILEAKPEAVRWLRRLPPSCGWRIDTARLMILVQLMSQIAPEWRPDGDREWEGFALLGGRLASLFRRCVDGHLAAVDLQRRVVRASAHWLVELRREGFAAAARRLDEDAADGADFANAADFLGAALRGCGDSAGARDAFWERISTVSLRRLVRCSVRWHGMPAPEGDQDDASVHEEEWPLVLRTPLELDGVRIEEMANRAALRNEGQRMSHCVAGYGPACQWGSSAVFSLRCTQFGHLSTLEIVLDEHSALARVVQHKAERNGIPAPALRLAAAALETRLNDLANRSAMRTRVRSQLDERARISAAGRYSDDEREVHALAWTELCAG